MASMEARLESLLTEVNGLHEALADEVKERRRDHDKLIELVTHYEGMVKLFDGFIDERGHDRRKIDQLKEEIGRLMNRLKPIEEYKEAREASRNQARIEAFAEVKAKNKWRWDLIAALIVGLLCAVGGVTFERMVFKEKKEPIQHQTPAKQP